MSKKLKMKVNNTKTDVLLEKYIQKLYQKIKTSIKKAHTCEIDIRIGKQVFSSNATDIVGKSIEEWVQQWFQRNTTNKLILKPNGSTQSFPDYGAILNKQVHPMDIKAFRDKRGPGFDVASSFDNLYKDLFNSQNKMFADYLVFAYDLNDKNNRLNKYTFTIHQVRLMRLWNLIGVFQVNDKSRQKRIYNKISKVDPNLKSRLKLINPKLQSRSHPLSVDVKNGNLENVRPFNFTIKDRHKIKNQEKYQSPELLLDKIEETRILHPSKKLKVSPKTWRKHVYNKSKSYIQCLRKNNLL